MSNVWVHYCYGKTGKMRGQKHSYVQGKSHAHSHKVLREMSPLAKAMYEDMQRSFQ